MKYRIFALILVMIIIATQLCGCAAQAPATESVATVEETIAVDNIRIADPNRKVNEASLKIYTIDPDATFENIPDENVPLAAAPSGGTLTKRDAEAIALDHAGFDNDQVSFLFTKLVSDEEIAHYEVTFRVGNDAYEIDVHSETGEILELSK